VKTLFNSKLLLLTAAGMHIACAPTARFPRELFAIEAQAADYPVMISRSAAHTRGRPVTASSGMAHSASSSTYSAGDTRVTVTRRKESQSELSASTKLDAQVRRKDRWLQIESALFKAEDHTAYGSGSSSRRLTIKATVYR
jgi:hypothetical protein